MGTVVDELHIFFFLHHRALIVYYMSLFILNAPMSAVMKVVLIAR